MIRTDRLELRPATIALLQAALDGPAALFRALGVSVPSSWPPEFLDDDALHYTIDRLAERPGQEAWWMYFVILRAPSSPAMLIGSAGYKGPPDATGTVEIGYGIVTDHRRRGYATEAARGLMDHALVQPGIQRVIAETLPGLEGSIGVLRKCGFQLSGEGSEPGVIRFTYTPPVALPP
jgi:RimJ/RimL family protein N-acetyltransferase